MRKNHVDRIKVKFIFFSFCVKYIIESKQRDEESFIISYFGNHTRTHSYVIKRKHYEVLEDFHFSNKKVFHSVARLNDEALLLSLQR